MPGALLAAARRVTITPPVGVDLTGFGARSGPSAGVHDDLRACALYLTDTARELLIITCDLIGLHHEEVAQVRAGISERAGIAPESVMICCSHTHSGPATRCLNYLGKQDEGYLSELQRRLVGLAAWAKSEAVPAGLGSTRAPLRVGVNRREWRDGAIVLGINETGPTAPHVDLLCVDDAEGRPLCRLFCHAAHAVTLGGDNLLLSGDWPGFAQREVERCYGPGCVAMFVQGCCGDINSHVGAGFEAAQAEGKRLATAVLTADPEAPRRDAVPLAAATIGLELPLTDVPSVPEARKLVADARRHAQSSAEQDNYGLRTLNEGMVHWARQLLALAEDGATGRTVPFEVQALRIGDLGIVGLPGEVFVDYALKIDADGHLPCTAVAAYTNGNIGYVPTAKAFAEGGYEVHSAIRFYGTTMQTPHSEELILQAADEVLAKVAI
jgi:hypothetical protein